MFGVETSDSFEDPCLKTNDSEWMNEYEGIVPKEYPVGSTDYKVVVMISQQGQTEGSEGR